MTCTDVSVSKGIVFRELEDNERERERERERVTLWDQRFTIKKKTTLF